MSTRTSAVVIGIVGITMGWISAGRSAVGRGRMDRAPRAGERLVRRADGKRFEVSYVACLAGGDRRFTLRADDGERASLDCGDLFPGLGKRPPYAFAD